jgi:hypothetical protein
MADQFEEISDAKVWIPENEGDSIIGVLLEARMDVGPNKSMLYTLEERGTQERRSVWGSTILDSRMIQVAVGEEIRIEFKGLGKKSPGKHAPKIFKVERNKAYQKAGEEIEDVDAEEEAPLPLDD